MEPEEIASDDKVEEPELELYSVVEDSYDRRHSESPGREILSRNSPISVPETIRPSVPTGTEASGKSMKPVTIGLLAVGDSVAVAKPIRTAYDCLKEAQRVRQEREEEFAELNEKLFKAASDTKLHFFVGPPLSEVFKKRLRRLHYVVSDLNGSTHVSWAPFECCNASLDENDDVPKNRPNFYCSLCHHTFQSAKSPSTCEKRSL